ncbi:nucleotidyltransferase family protein [Bacillus sp. 2205SS5-2]|uniref:nucleotidyltransferase family protein n=1 Tax=Bacillus sp. 2205SS5-2 TaxID=3109031 RepID=UPI00300502BB
MLKTMIDIENLFERDEEMLKILRAAQSLDLPDWWICAGFVRSKVWDSLHGFQNKTPLPDVDVIYFDTEIVSEHREKVLEEQLRLNLPGIPWSVKNQARMHVKNHSSPYTSANDAMSKFPETATALGVKLDEHDRVKLAAPLGVDDLFSMTIAPTPYFQKTDARMAIYQLRVLKKNWSKTWPKVIVSTQN